mmetsp:Transcript_33816/g.63119  ORF Transcript_33816/g.63119 Transcript_33816/m.63119 type:complete len:422 (-) Transcript_33816:35-1300(-)
MATCIGVSGAILPTITAILFASAAANGEVRERCAGQFSRQNVPADGSSKMFDLDPFDSDECLSFLQAGTSVVLPHSAQSLRKLAKTDYSAGARSPVSQLQTHSTLAVMDSMLEEFVDRGRQSAQHIWTHGLLLTTGNPIWLIMDAPLFMLFVLAAGAALYGLCHYIRHEARLRRERQLKTSKNGDALKLPLAMPPGYQMDVPKPRLLQIPEAMGDSKLLCPELSGAVVPEMCMFRFWMPMIGGSAALKDGLQKHTVVAVDSSEMFSLSVLRHSANPALPSIGPEDYITLSLPGVDRDLVVFDCGPLEGSTQRECSIFRSGQGPFGKISSNADGDVFYLNRADGQGMLTARVARGDGTRAIEITDKDGSSMVTAKWTTQQGAFKEYYEVACTPGCDVALSIVMVAGIDRILLPVACSSDAVP